MEVGDLVPAVPRGDAWSGSTAVAIPRPGLTANRRHISAAGISGTANCPDPGIMAKMFSQRSTTTRLLAAWMPLCVVWVFVACVSLCAAQSDECEKSLVQRLDAPQEASHCPIREAVDGLIPERQAFSPQAIPQAIRPSGTTASESYLPISASGLLLPSSADPPLKLLGVLRI
jgi:hypothetical protein